MSFRVRTADPGSRRDQVLGIRDNPDSMRLPLRILRFSGSRTTDPGSRQYQLSEDGHCEDAIFSNGKDPGADRIGAYPAVMTT